MGADGPERATDTDDGAHPHEEALRGFRAFEAAVNQPPVEPHRVPRAEGCRTEQQEDQKRTPAEIERCQHQGAGEDEAVPERPPCVPNDGPRQRAGPIVQHQGVDLERTGRGTCVSGHQKISARTKAIPSNGSAMTLAEQVTRARYSM